MAFMKRVLVDMSATLIHHGHIRILKKASKFGKVIVALTVDEEILKVKGYLPELEYSFRKEILESIRYVTEVVPSNWLIDESFLNLHRIDLLVHGDDNSNLIPKMKFFFLPRTKGITSKDVRLKISSNFQERPELLNKNE
jgi:cytidyltransferase-like protein